MGAAVFKSKVAEHIVFNKQGVFRMNISLVNYLSHARTLHVAGSIEIYIRRYTRRQNYNICSSGGTSNQDERVNEVLTTPPVPKTLNPSIEEGDKYSPRYAYLQINKICLVKLKETVFATLFTGT